MQLTVDTERDSRESIRKAIRFLESLIEQPQEGAMLKGLFGEEQGPKQEKAVDPLPQVELY